MEDRWHRIDDSAENELIMENLVNLNDNSFLVVKR